MKSRIRLAGTLLLIGAAGGWIWTAARGETELFDKRRAQRDIDVMCGILDTTLSYATAEPDQTARTSAWRLGSVRGLYLYGQGAVFRISVSGPRVASHGAGLFTVGRGAAVGEASEAYARALSGLEGQADDTESLTRAALALQAASEEDREKLEQRREQQREEMRKQLEAYRQRIAALEEQLIEALASYGSTLGVVGRDEYVTLILEPNRYGLVGIGGGRGRGPEPSVLSVRRSTITDHQAGKLTLEQFRAEVLRY